LNKTRFYSGMAKIIFISFFGRAAEHFLHRIKLHLYLKYKIH
jgi:hypothetical protein